MRPSKLKGRCYAEREAPRLSVANCLGLDPSAQGKTVDETKGKLDAIFDDVREPWDGTDQAYADALLNRRALLSYRRPFRWLVFRSCIRRHDNTHRSSNERLPLVLIP